MTTVAEVRDVSRRYRHATALDHIDLTIRADAVTGLLGRNGAGKTTLMQILTGQRLPSSGRVEVFGEQPYENAGVLSRMCFVRESQPYPAGYRVRDVLAVAGLLHARWDRRYAEELLDVFDLPRDRRMSALSRGMTSAVGIVVGLASRAPFTLFDEPYLGLDAVARRLFYDRLLADFAEHPRTIVLSTHLIDEVADLLEHVVVIDGGRVVLDADADGLRGSAVTVTGPAAAVAMFAANHAAGHEELRVERLPGVTRLTLRGALDPVARERATALGIELTPVSLQDLVVGMTGTGTTGTGMTAAGTTAAGTTAGGATATGTAPTTSPDRTPTGVSR